MRYDLAVIGNDEAAFEMTSIAAAAQLRTVAILPESRHSAWITAQALRQLVGELLVDNSSTRRLMLRRSGTPRLLQRLLARTLAAVINEQINSLETQGVDVVLGEARFRSPSEIDVSTGINFGRTTVNASNVVIGTGVRQTSMHRPLGLIPFQQLESLFTSVQLPATLCIVGGGELGVGLAALFSLFGVQTRLLTREDDSCAFLEMAESAGVEVDFLPSNLELTRHVFRSSESVGVVDCRRTIGFTESLCLGTLGVSADENGQLWCTTGFETWCSGIFGIGDVVGFAPDADITPRRQAERVLNRLTHRIRRPHYLRIVADSAVTV